MSTNINAIDEMRSIMRKINLDEKLRQNETNFAEMRGVLAPGKRKTYALASHATITIRSTRTDERFTYKIKLADCMKHNDECECARSYFVSLLNGPDNENSYMYLGLIDAQTKMFRLTRASKASNSAPSVIAVNWLVGHWEDPRVEVWHEGCCGRCGRKLTVPESIESGIGPTCVGRE